MTATIISNTGQYPFGMQCNQMVGRMISLNTTVQRLNEAVATASSGFSGVAGTEFEIIVGMASPDAPAVPNNFGVQQDPAAPGQKGQDFSYAVGQLAAAWATFWTAAAPYLEQLDNGGMSM
jgi:hypothetical protein